jgi:hypothetical protein
VNLSREMTRAAAGPLSVVQCVLVGGPHPVWSQLRQVHVVCPAAVSEATLMAD